MPYVDHGPFNEGPWEKWVYEISLTTTKNRYLRAISKNVNIGSLRLECAIQRLVSQVSKMGF